MKKNNKKGFTLAELLIVVAIIAVLVAIAIPVFTAQLDKAKQATDQANVRSWYASVVADGLLSENYTWPTSYNGISLKADEATATVSGTKDSFHITYSAKGMSPEVVIGNAG